MSTRTLKSAAQLAARLRFMRIKGLLLELVQRSVPSSVVLNRIHVLSTPQANSILSKVALDNILDLQWKHAHRTLRSRLLTSALTLYRSQRIPKGNS